jgi:hypothetical protein
MANIKAKPKKLYSVGDIIEISGLNRNQIYYWSKTSRIITASQEVPGRQLFDLRAVLSFRLAAELYRFGLSPERVAAIIDLIGMHEISVDGQTEDLRREPWDIFLVNRWKYEKKGFYLIGLNDGFLIGTEAEAEDALRYDEAGDPLHLRNSMIIDLLKMIHDVEEKTGETLE